MRIQDAKNFVSKARAAASRGNDLLAAELGAQAMQAAAMCRAKHAIHVAFDGGLFTFYHGEQVAKSCVYSSETKARAGRLVAETSARLVEFNRRVRPRT